MKNVSNYVAACMMMALPFTGMAQQNADRYVKHVVFPEEATLDEKVSMAARLVPTPQQLEWQKMELTAFLHFGINTFTDREWGDGTEDPKLFNPTNLDADQWVRTLKEAGFQMVILTAKHHDGFCLWPSRYTTHSVASSNWKDGKGDVVREVRDACTKYGMKFGVYLSPWDRNAPCYGDSPKYNQYFIDQLTELLTNYGEVHEVWFDGANGEGPNGKKQEYDWDRFYETIQRLQPKAVMAIMGDDVRWVGNEKGLGRVTEWSATVLTPGIYGRSEANNGQLGISNMSADLGSRAMLEKASELFWYPSEVDVSIRPGWFYHTYEDSKVKSVKQLMDIYCQSVGYNSVLLLNIPPDREGRINAADAQRLKEFAEFRKKAFADNRVVAGDTPWNTATVSSRSYALKPASTVNLVMVQEDIAQGQRIEKFTIDAYTQGAWKTMGEGTTVGYKRMLRFPDIQADSLRLTINESRLDGNVIQLAAYHVPEVEETATQGSWNDLDRSTWKLVKENPVTVDLGKTVSLEAFTYAPLNGETKPTLAFRYDFYVSKDGKKWKKVITKGEFSNIVNNPLPQTKQLPATEEARYIRLQATTVDGKSAQVVLEELGVSLAK
ncbi:alpha-L-fucosidase [Phocaeicola barnesiae]|nr:alpha-L-fucosidase [Phocaeicola barnesiae]MDM8307626.1 alpha-L-fucosidase [Phocaeicola barnesiae]